MGFSFWGKWCALAIKRIGLFISVVALGFFFSFVFLVILFRAVNGSLWF